MDKRLGNYLGIKSGITLLDLEKRHKLFIKPSVYVYFNRNEWIECPVTALRCVLYMTKRQQLRILVNGGEEFIFDGEKFI